MDREVNVCAADFAHDTEKEGGREAGELFFLICPSLKSTTIANIQSLFLFNMKGDNAVQSRGNFWGAILV